MKRRKHDNTHAHNKNDSVRSSDVCLIDSAKVQSNNTKKWKHKNKRVEKNGLTPFRNLVSNNFFCFFIFAKLSEIFNKRPGTNTHRHTHIDTQTHVREGEKKKKKKILNLPKVPPVDPF